MIGHMNAPLNDLLDQLEDATLLDQADALLETFARWAASTGRPLYSHQEEALLELLSGNHVIAQTPTGSGKSMIALAAHFISMARGGRSYYSAPLKALVSEKFFDLVDVFGAANVGMVTGDAALNPEAPIICCTAEILANQALREGADLDADCVVMDEFHFFADPQRGWAWQVPVMELTRTQFVLLSATLGDTTDIAAELTERTGRDVSVIDGVARPVPLEFEYMVDPVADVVERLVAENRAPIYVVHFTQADAVKTASALAHTLRLPTEKQKEIRSALHGEKFTRGFGRKLKELLLAGVGVHHAGMLPRYRRLVERLTQQGLLVVVCGTDTLGVGINVPIRTVLFTSLVKYDGRRSRHLSAREFHQISGRAGRPGFDVEGSVRALASEVEIEATKRKARMTAAQEEGDAARARKLAKRKKGRPASSKAKQRSPGSGVSWNRSTFDRLTGAEPEKLVPHFQTSHSMFLNVLQGKETAEARLLRLAEQAARTEAEARGNVDHNSGSNRFLRQFGDIYRSLLQAELIERSPATDSEPSTIRVVRDLPDDFALNQPLTPFALAVMDLLDPEGPEFALDLLSVIESVMESPMPVLFAQQRKARDEAYRAMRDEGLDYEQRRDQIEQVSWPKPLSELLGSAFETFQKTNPWVGGREPLPKSVVREMVEEGLTFSQFIDRYELSTSEGVLLRYLSDTYRALRQVLPEQYRVQEVQEITDWLRTLLSSVDSSLVSEWENLMAGSPVKQAEQATDQSEDEVAFGADESGNVRFFRNPHAMVKEIRGELFHRVEQMAFDRSARLAQMERAGRGELPSPSPENDSADFTDAQVWEELLGFYWDQHDQIGIGPDARARGLVDVRLAPSTADILLAADIDEESDLPRTTRGDLEWILAEQTILDPEGYGDWVLVALIDRAATMELNQPVVQTVSFRQR